MCLNSKAFSQRFISSLSLTFLSFPYFVYVFLNTELNYELFLLGLFTIGIDYLIICHIKKYFLNIIISTFFIVFFYCKIFYNDTEIILHQLRFKEFTLIFSVITLFLTFFILKGNEGNKQLNSFLFIFGCTFFFNANSNKFFNQKYILDQNRFKFENTLQDTNPSKAPVLFLLFDELSSSNEIFSFTKDSIDLHFDLNLKDNGFEVINDFKSNSTRTKFSMPSIFNFNLHKNSRVLDSLENIEENVTIQKSYYWLASNNLLVDSLKYKGICSTSYGLFPFKKGTSVRDFIYWWPSFLDPLRIFGVSRFLTLFFQNSFLKSIESVFLEVTTVDKFRESVFEKFRTLNPKKNNFYYFHFYAPHEPFTWGKEYKSENKLNQSERTPIIELKEHIRFRRFFLNKVMSLITSEKFKSSRIIIVGDHGFRFNRNEINPKLTNLYLYNYPKEILKDSDHVVQDLGYLILNSFK